MVLLGAFNERGRFLASSYRISFGSRDRPSSETPCRRNRYHCNEKGESLSVRGREKRSLDDDEEAAADSPTSIYLRIFSHHSTKCTPELSDGKFQNLCTHQPELTWATTLAVAAEEGSASAPSNLRFSTW